jgi:hypothetical protein
MNFVKKLELIDYNEIEKDDRLPQKIMEHKYNVVYNRDWKRFLNSIEWDGEWLRHDTEEEKRIKKEQRELNAHPFKNWI